MSSTGDAVWFYKTAGLQKTRNKCAELYFSSHNNITRWLGVNLGRTADTHAKSDGPKVNVRPFYRKFKSGSSETIHHLQRTPYFKIASYQNNAGLQKTPNICSNSIVQATTILRGSWGLISVGPRTHLRNPMNQNSICARFIGKSNLSFLTPYIIRRSDSEQQLLPRHHTNPISPPCERDA